MARTRVALALALTSLLQRTVLARPGTWREANSEYEPIIQAYRDIREPWYNTYPDRSSLSPSKREQVEVDVGFDGVLPTNVYGIPVEFDAERGKKNPILVRMLAQELYYHDDDFDDMVDARNLPEEMAFVLRYKTRDGSDVVAEAGDVAVKASFTGKAKLGWGLQAYSPSIMPAYIATMEFEYVAPEGGQGPVGESVVEVGAELPSGKVAWPSRRTDIRIEWLHGSAE